LKNKTILVGLYNPGPKGTYTIRLKIPPVPLTIVGSNNVNIDGDIFCGNPSDTNDCDLVFTTNIGESSNAYVKLFPASSSKSAPIRTLKELTTIDQIK
jgi:hypothetical protein